MNLPFAFSLLPRYATAGRKMSGRRSYRRKGCLFTAGMAVSTVYSRRYEERVLPDAAPRAPTFCARLSVITYVVLRPPCVVLFAASFMK